MKLIDVIAGIESFSEEDTIYVAEPWGLDALAIVALEPDDGGLPDAARNGGMVYFLEIAIARDFLVDLERLQSGSFATAEAKTHRLIQYAVNDA